MLKKILLPGLFALAFSSLQTACRENPAAQYGDSLIGARNKAAGTASEANLASLRKAVEAYRAANGENPRGLEDLRGLVGSDVDFGAYEYDPATGSVSPKAR